MACFSARPAEAQLLAFVDWVGQDQGNWMQAGNWSSGVVPGINDAVMVRRSTAVLDATQTVRSLYIVEGGSRAGTGTLTAGALRMDKGALTGSGTTIISGTSSLNGLTNQTVGSGHTLTLGGNSNWSVGDGSILNAGNVLSYGTFTDQGVATAGLTRRLSDGASGYFANVGTYIRQGSGVTEAGSFNNLGTLDVRQGTFRITGNSGSGGTVLLGSGAVLEYTGGNSWVGGTVSGPGIVRVNRASLAFNASSSFASALEASNATLDVQANQAIADLAFTASTRSGVGNLTVSNLKFNSGSLTGTGTTTVSGNAAFAGREAKVIGPGHTLVLAGATEWSVPTGVLTADPGPIQNSGTIRNTGVFTDAGYRGVTRSLGNDGIFENSGTYVHKSTGKTVAGVFNNTGTLRVDAGTFTVNRGSAVGGGVSLASGSALEFAGGNSSFTGALAGSGVIRVNGGSLDFDAVPASTINLELNAGKFTARRDIGVDTLLLNGGTRDGAGALTANQLTFAAGNLTGKGTTTITGLSRIQGSEADLKSIGVDHVLVLDGNTSWSSGGGGITIDGRIVNRGTFSDQAGEIGAFRTLFGDKGSFVNQGTYVRDGVGTTSIHRFSNTGALNLNGGTIWALYGSIVGGSVSLAAGTTLEFGFGKSVLNGAVSGKGTVRIVQNELIYNPSSGGASRLEAISRGKLIVSSDQSVEAFELGGDAVRSGRGNLRVGAMTIRGGTLTGSGETTVTGTTTFTNNNAFLFTLADGHKLVINGGGEIRGAMAINSGAALVFTGGNSVVTSEIRGDGVLRVVNGTVAFNPVAMQDANLELMGGVLDVQGDKSINALVLGGGTRQGSHVLQARSLEFNSGVLSGPGSTQVLGSSSFNGNGEMRIESNHSLYLSKPSVWAPGAGDISNAGHIISQGTFTDPGRARAGTRTIGVNGGGTFSNLGTYTYQGAGLTQINGLKNYGLMDIRSGVVQVDQKFNNRGTVELAVGTTLKSLDILINQGVLRGDGTIVTPWLVNGLTGVLDVGALGRIGKMSVIGDVVLSGHQQTYFDLGAGGASDLLAVSGFFKAPLAPVFRFDPDATIHVGDTFTVVTYGGLFEAPPAVTNVVYGGYAFELLYGAHDLRVKVLSAPTVPVPEPEVYALALIGIGVVGLVRWRRPRT
jgi:PEP-CTERM motif